MKDVARFLACVAVATLLAPAACGGRRGDPQDAEDAALSTEEPAGAGTETGADPVAPPSDPEATLAAALLGPTPLVDDLRELTEEIGGRTTGSRAMDRAVEWALGRFREAGLEEVHAEEYTAPRLWVVRGEQGAITEPRDDADPESDRLRVAARPMTVGTPPEGLEAPVVDVGDGQKLGASARLKGAWALVHTAPMKRHGGVLDDAVTAMATSRVLAQAAELGAAGVVWISERPGRELFRLPARGDAKLTAIPAALVEREGGMRIAKMLAEKRVVRMKLTLLVDAPENATAKNVVAEVRGREDDGHAVILGAHLDSWELGQGAQDDGCNAALVIDVARAAMALARRGARPRRTLRFALYSGEELGLYGSAAHAKAHKDDTAAMIVFDEGSTKMTGYATDGRLTELRPVLDAALGRFAGLGPFKHTNDSVWNMDSASYHQQGIVALSANQDWGPYEPDYHAETDTFDKVDTTALKVNAAVAGVTQWGLAEAEKLPPRKGK